MYTPTNLPTSLIKMYHNTRAIEDIRCWQSTYKPLEKMDNNKIKEEDIDRGMEKQFSGWGTNILNVFSRLMVSHLLGGPGGDDYRPQ